jgi:hypothetical protein
MCDALELSVSSNNDLRHQAEKFIGDVRLLSSKSHSLSLAKATVQLSYIFALAKM